MLTMHTCLLLLSRPAHEAGQMEFEQERLLTPVIPAPFRPKLEVFQAQLKQKMFIKELERNKETKLEHMRTKEDMNPKIPLFIGNSE